MKNPNLDLNNSFKKHSLSEWLESAEKLLKGFPLEKLNTKTYENILLKPLYTREDLNNNDCLNSYPGMQNYMRASKTSYSTEIKNLNLKSKANYAYLVSQVLSYKNIDEFNKLAKNYIDNGVNELNFEFNGDIDWGKLLDFKTLECFKNKTINIFPRFYYKNFNDYKKLFNSLNLITKKVSNISVGASFALASDKEINKYLDFAKSIVKQNKVTSILEAKHQKFHTMGADSITELVAVISTAKRYLELMIDNGFTQKDLGKYIRLSISIGPNFFMELAKFRAIRVLWAGIQREYGLEAQIHIHGYTGNTNKTLFDPYTNILRLSTEAMSAITGGVDSLEIGRFDNLFASYSDFSEHLSRNIHHILLDEFELANLIDPAGGSYFIETLTEEIIKNSWNLFQEVEKLGGVDKAPGFLEEKITKTREDRLKNINRRKDVLVGLNMYPDNLENYTKNLDDFLKVKDTNRLAYNYEKLKLACLKYKKENGFYPYIIQLNYGLTRNYRLRADWVSDFFKVAGLEVKQIDNIKTIEDAKNKINDYPFVIFCTEDLLYKEFVGELATYIKFQNNNSVIMLAGTEEKTIKDTNIDKYINVKTNNYEFLEILLSRMGVI